MPANLTPAYHAAERRYREAQTLEEKLDALEEMLQTIPKHKGTDKMQADLKRRISRTKDAITQGKKAGIRQKISYTVRREGAGQVALVGPANAGKSALLRAISAATPEVGAYPFTTQVPQPGMVDWGNVAVQVVDLPPFDRELSPPWLAGTVRAADSLAIVFSLASDDLLTEAEETFGLLEHQKTWLRPAEPPVSDPLRATATGEGRLPQPPPPAEADEDAPRPKVWPALIVANQVDVPGAAAGLELLPAVCPALPIVAVSAAAGFGLDELRAWLFGSLGKIRVYTKAPGKKPDLTAPFVVPRDSTLLEFAAAVHKDFAANLKSAKVWGSQVFDGQLVPRDYVVQDRDIIELRI